MTANASVDVLLPAKPRAAFGRVRTGLALVLLVCVPPAAAAAGYELGRRDRATEASTAASPTWIDQEVHGVGFGSGSVPFLKCTYHRADGTTRVVDVRYVNESTRCAP